MEISFKSSQNQLTCAYPLIGLKEDEQLTYQVAIKPWDGKYTFIITSEVPTDDPNRLFLYDTHLLEEVEAPGNTIKFQVLRDTEKIGYLYFNYYPNTDYKTFQVCLEVEVFSNLK
jgi:hypothetical protein